MPTAAMLHYDSFLSNFGVAAWQTPTNNVVDRLFPVVHVQKQSDKYRVWNTEALLRDDFERLPNGTESAGTDWTWSSDTYYADRWALHVDIDYQERQNADSDLDLEQGATTLLVSKGKLRLQRQIIADTMKTGVWGTDIAGVSGAPGAGQVKQWNDAASTPIADVDAAVDTMLATGLQANVMVTSQPVWRKLQRHASIAAQFKVTNTDQITEEMVARVLGLERIEVVRGVYTNSTEGQAATTAPLLGKVAWVGYIPDAISPMTPTPATVFSWDGVAGMPGVSDIVPIQRFRIDEIHSDRIEAFMAFDVKVTAPALGYFFNSIVA